MTLGGMQTAQEEGRAKPKQVRVDAFPRGSVLMNELMGLLMTRVAECEALRTKLYQANFHTTLSGQAMVRACLGLRLPCRAD